MESSSKYPIISYICSHVYRGTQQVGREFVGRSRKQLQIFVFYFLTIAPSNKRHVSNSFVTTTKGLYLTKIFPFSAKNVQALRRTRKGWKGTASRLKCLLWSQPRRRPELHQLERYHYWPTQHQHGRSHLLTHYHLWTQLPCGRPYCPLPIKGQHSIG